jgi:hypothetical protein
MSRVKLTESLTYAPYIIVRGRTEKARIKNLEIPVSTTLTT